MEANRSTTLLQLRYPEVYMRLIQEFQQMGLHSYDVKADFLEPSADDPEHQGSNNVTLRIRFGETFTEYEDLIMNRDLVSPDNESIAEFFKHCAQRAHQTLKDEYKESMNIGRSRRSKSQN